MHQQDENTLIPLKPFRYSIGLYVFAILMVALFCVSLWMMPEYAEADRKLARAERALEHKKYVKALYLYESLMKEYPNFEEGRVPAAIACFNIPTEETLRKAFDYLKGQKFNISEQIALENAVPEEIREYIKFSRG